MKYSKELIAVSIAGCIYTLYYAAFTAFSLTVWMGYEELGVGTILAGEILAFMPIGLFFASMVWLNKIKPEFFRTLNLQVLSVHLLILTAILVLHPTWQVYSNTFFLDTDLNLENIINDFVRFLPVRLLIYGITVGLLSGIMKLKERKKILTEESELQLQLERTKLKEIGLKLNPEVVYSNLDSIRHQALTDVSKASDMVVHVGSLLRFIIDNLEKDSASLRDNLEFFEIYFKVVQLRFSNENEINMETEVTPESLDYEIPSPVLLIPLLEELFFGSYSELISRRVTILFKTGNGRVGATTKVSIGIFPLNENETLERQLEEDEKVSEINSILRKVSNESYKFEVQVKDGRVYFKLLSGQKNDS